jgi:hypothetical protein
VPVVTGVVAPEIATQVVEELARSPELTSSVLDLLAVIDNHYAPWSTFPAEVRGRLAPAESAEVESTVRRGIGRSDARATKSFASDLIDVSAAFDETAHAELSEQGIGSPAALQIQATFSIERLDNAASVILQRAPDKAEEYSTEQQIAEEYRLRLIPREQVALLTDRALTEVASLSPEQYHIGSRSDLQSEVEYYLHERVGTYRHTNSKGVNYFLHAKTVTRRGGKQQRIWYFARDLRLAESVGSLPARYTVIENPRNGFLTLKKK